MCVLHFLLLGYRDFQGILLADLCERRFTSVLGDFGDRAPNVHDGFVECLEDLVVEVAEPGFGLVVDGYGHAVVGAELVEF